MKAAYSSPDGELYHRLPRVNTSLKQPAEGPRVELFGLLGSGNIGNDASMEAMLRYVQGRHPSAVIDVMCSERRG